MSEDTRPLKRTRLSDHEDLPGLSPPHCLSDLKHHDEFWFEDGNLLLVARRVGFRIYRGLLASQSSIFADMFAASSANAEELLDGCPVVHMSDSPGDLAHLLRVLLPKSQRTYYSPKDAHMRTFDEVFGVISLSHKYNVHDVEVQAVAALQDSGFSSDFKRCTGESQDKVTNINAISVVILARLTDTPTMLPVALYQCALMGGACLRGWQREDGSVVHLSSEDAARCFDGLNALMPHEILLPSCYFKDEPSSDCRTRVQCCSALRNVLVYVSSSKSLAKRRALDNWTVFIQRFALAGVQTLPGGPSYRICTSCEKELLARHRRERLRIWGLLPEIFGVTVEGCP